jgi:acid stress-induced BolA-like protein IbaG/YrbA
MALQILGSTGEAVSDQIRAAIAEAIPGAEIDVRAAGAGHFELRVVSSSFAGESRLRQQQRVLGSIAHLMKGDTAPVHAIDKLLTELPR